MYKRLTLKLPVNLRTLKSPTREMYVKFMQPRMVIHETSIEERVKEVLKSTFVIQ